MRGCRWATLACLALLVGAPLAAAQQREISGSVTAAVTSQPLPGAEVVLAGTRRSTLAGENGTFRIRAPTGDAVLIVTLLGYRSERASVPADRDSVTIALAEDVLQLEGVVVTGLAATVSRRNAANAVAVVPDNLLTRVPAQTLESALQGKVLGALIQSNSGAPGGGLQVILRGVSTINGESDPLWVVDGVIVSDVAIQSGAEAVTLAGGNQDNPVNRIADLNPRDIDRIEILKGASAAAIYGSRAANGVILITTKQGRPGKPQINVSGRLGAFSLSNELGSRRFESVEEVVDAFGEGAAASFTGRTFDYEKILYGENDLSYETSADVSGGTGDTRYYLSGLLRNDAGIMEGTGYQKQSLRVNLDQGIGSRFDVSLASNLIHSRASRALSNNDNTGTSFYVVLPSTPNFVDLLPDADGNYPDNPFERSNPVQTRDLLSNDEDVYRFIGSLHAAYRAIQGVRHSLQLIGDVGVDHFDQEDDLLFPPELEFEPLDGLPGTSILTSGDNTNLNASLNLAHTYLPGSGSLSVTTSAGAQYTESDLHLLSVTSRDLVAGQGNVDQGAFVEVVEDQSSVTDLGLYVQEEAFLLHERLLLTAGLRGDRSSANGDDEMFFLYPKAAASYRFTDVADWLRELKVRAAFGQTGNRPLFGQTFTPLRSASAGGVTGTGIAGTAGDPDLEPERQTELEAGFDATAFGDRAALEVSVYQKTITNLLLERPRAPSTGFDLEHFNGGELRDRGVELALSVTPVLNPTARWLFRTTFYANRSKIVDLPVPPFEYAPTIFGTARIEEGKSPTQIVGNDGLDAEGNVVVKPLGDVSPDFQMSFLNDVTVGGWNLYALWDWKQGGDVLNLTKLLYDFGQNSADFEPEGRGPCPADDPPTVDSPGCARVAGFGTFAGPYLEDGSYLKLRELSLSYDIASGLKRGLLGQEVRYVRLGVSGRDLLSVSPYEGLDPEVSNFGNQPITRNVAIAPFPPSRSVWLTLDVGF